MLSLKLFGVVSLAEGGRPVAGPAAQRRRLALLALLAAGPEAGVSREKLVGFLWPDTDSERARRFLADSLYSLRKALGQEAILAVGDNLQLNPAVVRSDVVDLRNALAREDWETAVALYEGPFLDGFFVPDAPDFSVWADGERAAFARRHSDTLERLARQAESRGDHAVASHWWRRLQVADPLNGRVALSLITALEQSGDPAAALQHVRVHEALLREELGIAPDAAVTAFAERLRSTSTTRTPEPAVNAPRPSVAPTVGDPTSVAALPAAAAQASAQTTSGARLAWLSLAALVVAIALGSAAIVQWARRPDPKRVFVTAFRNQTGDPALDPLARMAADWIARGLLQTGTLEVVSPTWMAYSETGDDRAMRSMARQAGAGTLVSGAYYLDGGALRFDAQVLDPAGGKLLLALDPVGVPVDSGTAGVELLRQRVAAALAARFGGPLEMREITARSQPPTYAAYIEYLEGVQLFTRFLPRQAAERFERAWTLDTTFHLARMYGVLSELNVGNRARADSLVRSLTLQRDRMATFDRMLLDVFEAELAGDNESLLRSMRRVAAMTPGSHFAVGYAVAALSSNRPREALETLRRLDPSIGPIKDSPRYWDWLTIARHLLGDHERELQEARVGQAQHPELRATMEPEIRALAALGKVDELERLLVESRSRSPQSFRTPGDVMRVAAAELRAHGHAAAAAEVAGQAIAWYRARPESERARHAAGLARALYDAERWDESRAHFERLASLQPNDVSHLGYLGTLAARRGERAEAERIMVALASSTQLYPHGANTLWRSRIAAQLGEHERALQLLRESFSQGLAHGIWLHVDPNLAPLARDRAFRELVRPKG